MSTILATPGQSVRLPLVRQDGDGTLFPSAKIYRASSQSLVFSSDMSHAGDGVYFSNSNFVVPDEDKFQIVYIVYTDAGRTTEPVPPQRGEDLLISDQALLNATAINPARF